jgi:hypothetical protein
VSTLIPYLPFAGLLGFGALPASALLMLIAVTILYVLAAELTKARLDRAAA